MAGQGPYDWNNLLNMLNSGNVPSPDYPTPGTQGSSTPGYQMPRPPTESVYRPFMGHLRHGSDGSTQSLSQIRETEQEEEENSEENQEETPPETGDQYESTARHPYTAAETEKLFEVWIATSEDPIVGNQQTRNVFWAKVAENYNRARPRGSPTRTAKMLRCHFGRVDSDLKKFCGLYKNEAEQYQSGASEADILRAAVMIFLQDTGRAFKYAGTWNKVRYIDRWAGGIDSSTGSSSKRTKHAAGGQYSSSSGGGGQSEPGDEEVGSQFAGADAGGSSSGGRRRPIGTKAAKARARGRGRGGPSQTAPSQEPNSTLMSLYFAATTADTSIMTPFQFRAHCQGIRLLQAQLGLPPDELPMPPPQQPPQPPTE